MYLLRRRIFTMARGDAFLKPRSNRILRSLGLLPIFRATDADPRESVKRNSEAFDETYELLKRDLAIIIFPEAIASPEKKVRPLRKGTARLAVDMVKRSDFSLDLHVVPIGMNYTFFGAPRKDLLIEIGEPVSLLEARDEIETQEARFVNGLTKKLQHNLEALMVLAPENREDELDKALEIVRSEFPTDPLLQFDRSGKQFTMEKYVSDRFFDPDHTANLSAQIREYVGKREQLGVREYERFRGVKRFFHGLYFVFSFVPALLAGMTHGWTLALSQKLTPGKIRHKLFFDSMLVGILLVGIYAMALLMFPLAFVLYSWGGVLIYWMFRWLIPVYYQNVEIWRNFQNRRTWLRRKKERPQEMAVLEEMRNQIVSTLAVHDQTTSA